MTETKATNVTWHEGHVSREERASLLKQKGATLWFTGLSGSGKSTIAFTLEHALVKMGRLAYESAILTAAVVFLLAVASIFQYLMGVSGVPKLLAEVLGPLKGTPWLFLLVTALITERGVCTASGAGLLSLYPEQAKAA